MKTLKKVLALVLACTMMFSLGMSVFAEEAADSSKTITINNETSGYEYKAYQVFAGDLSGTTLSNIVWGADVNVSDKAAGKLALGELADGAEKTAAEWAEWLGQNQDQAEAFAKAIKSKLNGNGYTSVEGSDNYTITVPADGYYFVENTTVPETDGAYTSYILKVVGPTDVDPKSDIPTVDKEVYDVNDSKAVDEKTNGTWGKTADHDINDEVPFRLTGTLPDNYADYTTYQYIFHDTLSKGLTLNKGTIKVYVDNGNGEKKEITAGFEIVEPTSDGCSFEVKFTDLKSATVKDGAEISKDSKIVVEYTATLNDDAEIGNPGNPNEVYLEYSNNPNYDGTGDNGEDDETGKTPEKKVLVFTYELDVDKVGENGTDPLKGAGFTLSKKNESGEYEVVKFTKKGDKYYVDPEGSITELSGEDLTHFQFVGLDDGDYKLEESTVPAGYNKAADIEFSISASDDGEELTEVNFGNAAIQNGDGEASGSIGTGTAKVVNKPGTTLPSTGGIGTTIFYVVGSLMVIFAGVLLIVKRRMKVED